MHQRLCTFAFCLAVLPLAAQLSSALPADRLALANQLVKRGLHAEALKEYEAIREARGVPRDEVLFKLGETYRSLRPPRTADALKAYADLLREFPSSRYVDYARINRAMLQEEPARTRELLDLDRPEASEQIRATALYYLGEAAEKARKNAEAVKFFLKAAEVSRTNDVACLARLRSASLLAASPEPSERRHAQTIYLDMADSADARLAEESLYYAGMLSYREGRYGEASSLFRRLADRFPAGDYMRESQIYASWSNYLCGRYSEALQLAADGRAQGIEDAVYLTAASLKMLERKNDALAAYTEYLQKYPKGRYVDSAWFERLAILAAQDNSKGVLDELARRGDPPEKSADRAWSYGCEAAIAVTNFPLAIEYARLIAVHTNSPYAPNAVHRLAWLLEKTGDWTKAASAYRMMARHWPDNPASPQAQFMAGVTELKAKRPERARADWTALLEKFPDSPVAADALYARAMEEIRAGEFRAADRSLGERVKRFPHADKKAEVFYWWGVAARGADDDPEAEKHLRAALAAEPTAEFEREIRLELAMVLQRRGKDAEAAQLFAGILDTKAVDRLPPSTLSWVAESMLETTNTAAAQTAARIIEKRNIDASWNQIGATLTGRACESLGEQDAAAAAYLRALKTGARTDAGAQAALALGRLETSKGLFDEAKEHLADAVARAQAPKLIAIRVQAYAALAHNEEERGDAAAALGYHMLVGTLFDDPGVVPHALARAAAILKEQGKVEEAKGLMDELKKRYPKAVVETGRKD
ncbi:MAG: tol-pal system YbgF family protein [Kiritimatiellia bacterium]